MSKIILITGASRGFGKLWAEAFLKQGDSVVATARNIATLSALKQTYGDRVLLLTLDVNNREACFEAITKAFDHFGRIDVLINNAGYGLFGTIEETSEEQARAQMETNFFGLLWMTQAVLPVMRAQGSGHIIQVSSFLGLVTLPVLGLYNASKFAVEGLSETLSMEVKGFGIHITLVEPNGFLTDWASASAVRTTPMEAYAPLKASFQQQATAPGLFGDPAATTKAITTLVASNEPPLRLLLGKIAYPAVKEAYKQRLEDFEKYSELAIAAHGS